MPDTETEMNPSIARALDEARALQAPLADRLQLFAALLEHVAPRYAHHYHRLIERLVAAKAGKRAPRVGDPMPDFALPDAEGCLVTLAQLVTAGPLVLSFNRGHWCELCRLELGALAEADREVRRLGGSIVSIMPETSVRITRLRSEDKIPFQLLRDTDNAFALSIGLAIAVDQQLAAMMIADGIDLAAEVQYIAAGAYGVDGFPFTTLLDGDGKVVARWSGEREPDQVLDLITSNLDLG